MGSIAYLRVELLLYVISLVNHDVNTLAIIENLFNLAMQTYWKTQGRALWRPSARGSTDSCIDFSPAASISLLVVVAVCQELTVTEFEFVATTKLVKSLYDEIELLPGSHALYQLLQRISLTLGSR